MPLLFAEFGASMMEKAVIVQRKFIFSEGIGIVSMFVPEAHTFIEQHQHDISHVTFVAAGSVIPIIDSERLAILRSGQGMTVEAFKTHCFETLEPNTILLCITNTIAKIVNDDHPKVLPEEFIVSRE